jgi:hypothetical protein
MVVVTEGTRPVGLFTVEEVDALAPDGTTVKETAPEPPTALTTPYRHSTAAARWAEPETAGAS